MSERLETLIERIDGNVDALRVDVAELKAMRAQVEEHHERIYGNGQPGLVKDVDRLKQERKNLRWWLAAILIPSIAAAADFVRSMVSK